MKITSELNKIEYLIPLPDVVDQMQELFHYPYVSNDEILDLISIDPALALLLLNHANTSTLNIEKIDSIEKACSFLELSNIKEAVLPSFCASKSRNYSYLEGIIWKHSMVSAIIAAYIAERIDERLKPLAYTAGLIHDLGIMILAQYFPGRFFNIINVIEKDDISFYEAEKLIAGPTHTKIGEKIAKHWNLPPSLIGVIAYHHTPSKAKFDSKLIAIISYADIICNKFGIGFCKNEANKEITHNILRIADINEIDAESIVFCLREVLDDYRSQVDSII